MSPVHIALTATRGHVPSKSAPKLMCTIDDAREPYVYPEPPVMVMPSVAIIIGAILLVGAMLPKQGTV